MRKKTIPAFFISAMLFSPLVSIAHTQGRSFEQDVGNFLVDIAYDPPTPIAGDQTYFDFDLYEHQPAGDAQYDDVWVRIEQGKTTIFATGIAHMAAGSTGVVYTFPSAGVYTVSARYEKGDTTLAEVSFPVAVSPREARGGPSRLYYGLTFILGLVACPIIVFVFKKYRKKI